MARLETLFDRFRRRGDARALGRVFDRTAPALMKVAHHLVRHPAEAEDLVQDTFLTAIERAEVYDPGRPLVPWLVGILRNHARRLHRRRRASPLETDAVPAPAAEEPWLDVPLTGAVEREMASLPPAWREVVELRLRHGRAPAEIAVLLALAPATVRSRLHRGLTRLRERLAPHDRPRALGLLPAVTGLAFVRRQVMARAATAVAGGGGATVVLPILGGLVVSKPAAVSALLLLVALLGGGAWLGLHLGARPAPPTPADGAAADPASEAARLEVPVRLAGRAEGEAEDEDRAETAAASSDAGAWPPDLPIPADKGSVAGTLRFEDGTPVVGAVVGLWGTPAISATTDARGRFHIHADWVHDRALFLRFRPEGEPDHLGLLLSNAIPMRRGELVMQDVVLERGLDLVGIVTDQRTGVPLEDANVTLRRTGVFTGQAVAGFARTDAQGRFAFPYVPADRYSVLLEREGYEAVLRDVDLGEGRFPERWPLLAARVLEVVVEDLPAAGVGVEVACELERTDGVIFSVTARRTLAADGVVRLDAPEPGTYRLTLRAEEVLPVMRAEVRVPEGVVPRVTLRVAPGGAVEGVLTDAAGRPVPEGRIRIADAGPPVPTDERGRYHVAYAPAGVRGVQVRVEGAWVRLGEVEPVADGTTRLDLALPGTARVTGRLLAGGRPVSWTEGEVQLRVPGEGVPRVTARPAEDGAFVCPGLAAGAYELFAWIGDGMPSTQTLEVADGQVLDLGAVQLRRLASVTVRLVLAPGLETVPSLSVSASRPEAPQRPWMEGAGGSSWLLLPWIEPSSDREITVRGLPPAHVLVTITGEGLAPATLDLDLATPPSVPPELRLEPAR